MALMGMYSIKSTRKVLICVLAYPLLLFEISIVVYVNRLIVSINFIVKLEDERGIYISYGEAEATRSELEAILSHKTFDERYNACMKELGDYDVCVAVAAAGEQLRQAVDEAAKRPGVSHKVVVEGLVLDVVYTGGSWSEYDLVLKPVEDSLNIYWTGDYHRVGVSKEQVWYIDGHRYEVVDGPSLVVMYQALQRYLARLSEGKTVLYREWLESGLRKVTEHLDYLSGYIPPKQQVIMQGQAGYIDVFNEILNESNVEVAKQKCLSAFGASLCDDVIKMRELLKVATLRAKTGNVSTYIIDGNSVLQVDRHQSAVFIRKMDLIEFLKSHGRFEPDLYDTRLVLYFGGKEYRVKTYVDLLKALKDLRQYLADLQRRSAMLSTEAYSNVVGLINERIRETEKDIATAIKSAIGSRARELEKEMQNVVAIVAEFENNDIKTNVLQYIEAVGADVAKVANELKSATQGVKASKNHTSLRV